MTKEQEAIERCKSIVRVNKDFLKGNKQTINQEEIDCIEAVLNMLKEKDKEIEKLKQALARNIAKNITSNMKEKAKAKEDLEMLNQGWQMELEKKDKIIDRMSITIIQKDIGKDYCEFNKSCEKCEDGSRDLKCKDCIKQYFKEIAERKSEK